MNLTDSYKAETMKQQLVTHAPNLFESLHNLISQ